MEYKQEEHKETITTRFDVIYVSQEEYSALRNAYRDCIISHDRVSLSSYNDDQYRIERVGKEPKLIMKLTDPHTLYSVEFEVMIKGDE